MFIAACEMRIRPQFPSKSPNAQVIAMETTETRIVDGLLTPEIYPHPSTGVELVETHISWVLLTGLRAYKIKKPVNLGFVDFTTLERRKHFCEEEIRLNRRLAPDLYLDVVPITGSIDNPQIDGEGPVIEYAVRMRQFDKAHLLTALPPIELTVTRIEQLADDCAAFHGRADAVAPDSHFGTPESNFKPVLENFAAMGNCDDSICESVADLRERVDFLFGRLIHAFKERKLNGRVRECHGDLHLGNMFLQDAQIAIFDGIEFNDSLRWIDVVNDIAFLVMDLTVRGHRDLANRFLNRWLEQTGDYDGLKVLSFFCSYRAAVRAKVDVIRIHQPDVAFSEQRHLAHDCCDYLKLAQQYLIRHPPSLTITMGLSGSGKTTATERLIDTTDVIRIRSDVERKRMHGLGLMETSAEEIKSRMYSEQSTAAVYDRLKQLAATVIDAGYPVVVDATFLKRSQRQSFARLAESLGVPFAIIHCQANESVLRERIRDRQAEGGDASEAGEDVLDSQLKIIALPDAPEQERVTIA
jgi:aminoglycoside phosphotransferase family enzyme/predicted kinase